VKAKIQTILLGLGAIGSKNDRGLRHPSPLSHAGAILQNPRFELVAAIDPDPDTRDSFCADWRSDAQVHSTMDEIEHLRELDLAVVASPTRTHHPLLDILLSRKKLKAIFCEKPFCSSLDETENILTSARKHGTQIVVNYHRRWDPKITAFREVLKSLGMPYDVQVTYGKGLYNYGSHIIDLMTFFWGPVEAVCAESLGTSRPDLADPSLSATVLFSSGARARLNGCDGVDYDLFDLVISYRSFRYRLEAGGYRIVKEIGTPDVYFSGYNHLQASDSDYAMKAVTGLHKAYEELALFLETGVPLRTSTGDNALQVARVLDAIRRSDQQGGRTVFL
jgi:predicted dehydrogenase